MLTPTDLNSNVATRRRRGTFRRREEGYVPRVRLMFALYWITIVAGLVLYVAVGITVE